MNKDKVISVALILIIVFKLYDLYIDFTNQAEMHHVVQELVLIALSLSMFLYVMYYIRQRRNQTSLLRKQLAASHEKSHQLSQQVLDSKKAFFDAIYKQFDDWGLSPTEKEIALLLVKGLSNAEIAQITSKAEKTVRHQSSSVYKKASVQGRHELVALFFEVLIT